LADPTPKIRIAISHRDGKPHNLVVSSISAAFALERLPVVLG
jgi:hypothetical protein